MPVGGRVAGKGVGVHNSGGSSDGNVTQKLLQLQCYTHKYFKIRRVRSPLLLPRSLFLQTKNRIFVSRLT